jgi:arylsulfatase
MPPDTRADSQPDGAGPTTRSRPDVVLVLADDMGYSDIGCYGGEIDTPSLDRLAQNGLRMSRFYNTARCSPSRASLLTGLHPHRTGIGVLTNDDGPTGYPGTLNDRCVTMAEVLGRHGYGTYMSGKWHLTGRVDSPNDSWPTRRGFDRFYGILDGAATYYWPRTRTRGETNVESEPVDASDYYLTTAIGEQAAGFIDAHCRERAEDPFLCYVPFTAPHWPLHAPEQVVRKYRGRFSAGWDELRAARYRRAIEAELIDASWADSDRDSSLPAWADPAEHEWQERRMEVYAAQVELMDRAVGQVVAALERNGRLDNTLFVFLSDNGGCAEELPAGWVDELASPPRHTRPVTRAGQRVRRGNAPDIRPGGEDTFSSYGKAWANLSNTPFREYKHWVHEGGIATPMVVHWPVGLGPGGVAAAEPGGVCHAPHQLPDVLATVLEATGADYPAEVGGRPIPPPDGTSMLGSWRGERPTHTLYWEHEGNAAVRRGRWKLVRRYPDPWELYDIAADRTELHDRAAERPDVVRQLAADYRRWAHDCGVLPRSRLLALAEEAGR